MMTVSDICPVVMMGGGYWIGLCPDCGKYEMIGRDGSDRVACTCGMRCVVTDEVLKRIADRWDTVDIADLFTLAQKVDNYITI